MIKKKTDLKGRKCVLQKKKKRPRGGLIKSHYWIFSPTSGSSVSDCLLYCVRTQISPEEGDSKSLWNSPNSWCSPSRGEQFRTMLILSKTPTALVIWSQLPLSHKLFMSLLQCSLFCVWFPNESWWHLLDEPNSSEPISLDSASSVRRGGIFPRQVFPSPGPGFLDTYMKDLKHPLCQTIFDLQGSKSSLVTEFINLDMKTLISRQEFSQWKSTPCSSRFVIIHSFSGGHSSHCFHRTQNKEEIWNTEAHYWQKQSHCELVKKSEERGESPICQRAESADFIWFSSVERWRLWAPNDGGLTWYETFQQSAITTFSEKQQTVR